MILFTSKIIDIEPCKKNISKVILEKPNNFEYFAGQYCFLGAHANDTAFRPYSIASAPHEDVLIFHVKDVKEASSLSSFLCDKKNIGKTIHVKQAEGDMTFPREFDLNHHYLFLCAGVGLSPIWSILKNLAFRNELDAKISIYWGMNSEDEFYEQELLALLEKFKNCNLTVCAERFDNSKVPYSRQKGLVGDAVTRDFNDLNDMSVFIAGPTPMVQHTLEALSLKELEEINIYCDYKFLLNDFSYKNKAV